VNDPEPVVADYDFHPPDDMRLFPMPRSGVLRLDEDVFVAEVRYGDIVVRHYAFRDHWFKINCTTDLSGQFVETTSPDDVPPFTFNCDIATPMVRDQFAVYAVDLWLDVLVRADGRTYGVYDEDEFEEAIAREWLSPREAVGARAGLRELIEMIEHDQLIAFLGDVQPFGAFLPPEAQDTRRTPVAEAPVLQPGRRPSW
jgi:hypothetical protein